MHGKIKYEMVGQNAHIFSLQKLLTSRKHDYNIRKGFLCIKKFIALIVKHNDKIYI